MRKSIVKMLKKTTPCMIAAFILLCFIGCGHEHTMAERTVKEKTCTANGAIELYCTSCDYKYTKTVEPSHSYEKTVSVEATCTAEGAATFICKECGDTYSEALPKASHTYENKYCTVCGVKRIGTIKTPHCPQSFDYGAGGDVRTSCKITSVRAELDYGIMTVYFSGIKTYDVSGDTINGPVSFMLIVKDQFGSILYSDQIMTHCIVNQTFSIHTPINLFFDDSEDYRIELADYMMQ